MLHALTKQRRHMIVVERIEDRPAFPAAFDKTGLTQQPQLVRNGADGHAEQFGQVANADLFFEQHAENAQPRRVLSRQRTDIPGMSLEGEGLEYALAELLGEKILSADEKWDKRQDAVKFIPVTPMTASAKLTDGTVDMLFCMMPKGGSSSFAYSSSYYDDPCRFVFRKGEGQRSVKNITVGFLQSASTSGLYVPTGIYETMVDNYVEAHPDDGLITTYKYNDDTIDLSYASYDELFDALRDGEVDAIVLNDLMLNKLDSEGEFDRSEVTLGNISYAAATSTATPALTSLMDVLLDDLRVGGTLEALYLRYGLQR